ncbi:hypothetical protein D3C74_342210 [compost metagenome]
MERRHFPLAFRLDFLSSFHHLIPGLRDGDAILFQDSLVIYQTRFILIHRQDIHFAGFIRHRWFDRIVELGSPLFALKIRQIFAVTDLGPAMRSEYVWHFIGSHFDFHNVLIVCARCTEIDLN